MYRIDEITLEDKNFVWKINVKYYMSCTSVTDQVFMTRI